MNKLAPSLIDALTLGKEVFIAEELIVICCLTVLNPLVLKNFALLCTLLGVILTTSQVLVIQSDVICTSISDHFPVSDKTKASGYINFKTRNYKHYNPVDFNRQVAMISWDVLNNVDDLNDKVDVFSSLLGLEVERHAPISQMRFKHKGNS